MVATIIYNGLNIRFIENDLTYQFEQQKYQDFKAKKKFPTKKKERNNIN